MAEERTARHKGHDIRVVIDDDGGAELTVDGKSVPMNAEGGMFKVTYFEPTSDPIAAAKRYVDRLPRG